MSDQPKPIDFLMLWTCIVVLFFLALKNEDKIDRLEKAMKENRPAVIVNQPGTGAKP